jgi:hypothetical protein
MYTRRPEERQMIDFTLVANLIDKFRELVEHRNTRDRARFETLIEETYTQLSIIHTDLLNVMTRVNDLLATGASIQTIETALGSQRNVLSSTRHGLSAQMDVFLLDNRFTKYHPYFHSIQSYLRSTPDSETHYHVIGKLLDLFSEEEFQGQRQDAAELISRLTETCRDNWQGISRAYALLQAQRL